MAQLVNDIMTGQLNCTLTRNDQNIEPGRKGRPAAAKKFPYHPLNAVANHRVANLAANRDTKARLRAAMTLADNHETRTLNLETGSRHMQKLGALSQPGRLRKSFLALQRVLPILPTSRFGGY